MKRAVSLLLWVCLSFLLLTASAKEAQEPLKIYFFHNIACESCNERQNLEKAIEGENPKNIYYELVEYPVFKPHSAQAVESLKKLSPNPAYPILIVGKALLSGYDEIRSGFAAALESYAATPDGGFNPEGDIEESAPQSYPQVPPDTDYGVLFTTENCDSCKKVKGFLKDVALETEERSLIHSENTLALQDFFEAYSVPSVKQQVPILFLRDKYLSGQKEIEAGLIPILEEGGAKSFTYPQAKGQAKEISPLAAIGAGLVNGLNPCALSMLFLLLSMLVNMRSKLVPCGLSYIAGKIAAYFGLGLLLCIFADSINLAGLSILKNGAAIVLLVFSLLFAAGNLLDFFNARRERYGKIIMQLPAWLRKKNAQAIEGTLSKRRGLLLLPIIFLLGLLISAGELLCTGQIFLASIIYAAQSGAGIPYATLAVYVGAMCLPSLIAVLLAGCGKRVLDLSEFSRKHLPAVKLISAILFVIFGGLALWMLI